MKYPFIEQQCQDYPVRVLCRVLEVSESVYYQWRKRKPQHKRQEADKLLAEQGAAVFGESHQT